MAKNTLPPGLNSPSRFLIGRTSKFQPEDPGLSYYVGVRHTRGLRSLQDVFLYSFDSQIVPNLLPSDPFGPFLDNLILTEFSNPLLTEIGQYLLIELD